MAFVRTERSVYLGSLQVGSRHVYWHELEHIWRSPKDDSSAPESLYETACRNFLVLTDGRLALQTDAGLMLGSGDGVAALQAISSGLALGASKPCGPLDQAGTQIFHLRGAELVGTSISGMEEEAYGEATGGDLLFEVSPPYAYDYDRMGNSTIRRRLDEPRYTQMVVARATEPKNLLAWRIEVKVHDDGVYTLSSAPLLDGGSFVSFERASLTEIGTVQSLPSGGFVAPRGFIAEDVAVGSQAAFLSVGNTRMQRATAGLIYRIQLP